jgi:antitoxin (DNA-binding transcriptional repressor) of toxin-antitoxin stability system
VEHGHEILVTKSGRLIAKLVPADDDEETLRSAGLHPPRKPGMVPKVPPVCLARGKSLTRIVLEGRE